MIKIIKWLRDRADALLYLIGAAAVSYGAWRVYPPAGWIAAGIALIALALLL